MKFSERLANVKPSATLEITSKAKAMAKEGKDVVVLAAGEPDFDTPDVIKEAAIKAIRDGFTKYTPSSGTLSLKEAICRKLSVENGLNYRPAEVVVSSGAKHSLYNIFQVVCNEGDEILIVHPYWLSYPDMVILAGGVPKIILTSRENGFKVTPEEIKSAITPRTKAIVLNSPSNPAGVVYDQCELEAIASVCVSKGLLIISDEIYETIIFDGKKHVSIASISSEAKARTIVVNGVSKSYSMTGWRIGYMAGDKEIANGVDTVQSQCTSNPCSISQAAAECALRADLRKFIEESRKKFEDRRDFLVNILSDVKGLTPFIPQGAFYLFCDISAFKMDSVAFSKRLLEDKHVAVIPGGPFGDDRYIRLSFATNKEVMEKGVNRIKEWLKGGNR